MDYVVFNSDNKEFCTFLEINSELFTLSAKVSNRIENDRQS